MSYKTIITLSPLIGLLDLMTCIPEDEFSEFIKSENCITHNFIVYSCDNVSFKTFFSHEKMMKIKERLSDSTYDMDDIVDKFMWNITKTMDTNLVFNDYRNLTIRPFNNKIDNNIRPLPNKIYTIFNKICIN